MLEFNFSPFPELITERLLLRRIITADALAILTLRSLEIVMQFIDREKPKDIEDAKAFVALIDERIESNNGINWAITLKDDPAFLIGIIGFWRTIKQHHRAEIGYMLHPDYWHKGLMKEAVEKVIDYGFGPMQLHSIEAHINPGNIASAKLLEKTGFVREAYFKEDFYFRDRFIDTAIYSLLAK